MAKKHEEEAFRKSGKTKEKAKEKKMNAGGHAKKEHEVHAKGGMHIHIHHHAGHKGK
jgi:hypothetical protein